MAARTLEENLRFFEAEEITVGQVADISDLVEHPFILDRGILLEFPDDEMGGMPMHNVPVRLSETPGAIRRPAPTLGQHNAELLAELGLDAGALKALADDGVI
jgi:formyl-CoA transferase